MRMCHTRVVLISAAGEDRRGDYEGAGSPNDGQVRRDEAQEEGLDDGQGWCACVHAGAEPQRRRLCRSPTCSPLTARIVLSAVLKPGWPCVCPCRSKSSSIPQTGRSTRRPHQSSQDRHSKRSQKRSSNPSWSPRPCPQGGYLTWTLARASDPASEPAALAWRSQPYHRAVALDRSDFLLATGSQDTTRTQQFAERP